MMDTGARLLTKSLTWQISGLITMTLIGYLFTGSFTAGGALALVSVSVGFVCYLLHELAWRKVRWGRRQA